MCKWKCQCTLILSFMEGIKETLMFLILIFWTIKTAVIVVKKTKTFWWCIVTSQTDALTRCLLAGFIRARWRVPSLREPGGQPPRPSAGRGGASVSRRRGHRGIPGVRRGVRRRAVPPGGGRLWAGRGQSWGHLHVIKNLVGFQTSNPEELGTFKSF